MFYISSLNSKCFVILTLQKTYYQSCCKLCFKFSETKELAFSCEKHKNSLEQIVENSMKVFQQRASFWHKVLTIYHFFN